MVAPEGQTLRTRISAHDWSATQVGHQGEWPETLSTLVEVMLGSNFPMFLTWGEEQTLLYNDAYTDILGNKHPWALGRPFLEVWPEAGGGPDSVLGRALGGEAVFFLNHATTIERYGRREPACFTFSYSPLREAVTGAVRGVLCVCHETTEAMEAQRHAALLVDLDTRLRPLHQPSAIIAEAQLLLGQSLAANRVGYGRLDASERFFTTTDNWTDGALDAGESRHDLSTFGTAVLSAMRAGERLIIDDVADVAGVDGDVMSAFAAIDARAVVTVSLVKEGALRAALYVHQRTPRRWTAAEVRLIEAVAERIWSAVERADAEAALRQSEARFREFFEAAGDAIFIEDQQGRYSEVNAAACRLLGYARHELIGMKVRDVVAAHDVPRIETWRRSTAHGHPSIAQWRLRRKDGTWVDVEISAQILANGGVEAVVRDVTRQRADEARRALMLNELNHRVKNSLATVQAIAAQTFRGHVDPALRETFAARLIALARANDILVAEAWEGADLRRIAADVARPFAADQRFLVDGPPVILPAQAATSMALALHELATNAAKYGALSTPSGCVRLQWTDSAAPDATIELVWRETGGPPVSPPDHTGFGTRLVRDGLRTAMAADVELAWEPEGLVCTIRAKRPHLPEVLDLQAHTEDTRRLSRSS